MKNYFYMDKKTFYTSPQTTLTVVEMEGQICGASTEVRNPNAPQGRIENQGINTDFDDFGGGSWGEEQ